MTKKTPLGDRMKRYEHQTRHTLPKRTYTLIRVDGKAFHTYTKNLEKPFDYPFMSAMSETAQYLCENIAGSVFAYTQSDEISILLQDFKKLDTEPWMGGVLQKMCSVSAALASAKFSSLRGEGTCEVFDSRVWTISDPNEVMNYFIWRQRDCEKNSITMAALSVCSHKELEGLNSNQRQEAMFQKGINWNSYPAFARRGTLVSRTENGNWWAGDAPKFNPNQDNWIVKNIPNLPALVKEEE